MPSDSSNAGAPAWEIARASWLSDEFVAVNCSAAGTLEDVDVVLCVDGENLPLEVRDLEYTAATGRPGALLALRPLVSGPPDRRDAVVSIRDRSGVTVTSGGAEDDLRVLARSGLAALDAQTRARAVAFLASTLSDPRGIRHPRDLSASLRLLRDALRERLPYTGPAAGAARALRVDALLAASERSFFIRGWLFDVESPILRLTAVSPEGARAELFSGVVRRPRPDLEAVVPPRSEAARDAGFLAGFTLDEPSILADGWILEAENAAGDGMEVAAPPVVDDPPAVRDGLLASVASEPEFNPTLMSRLLPVVTDVQSRLGAEASIDRVMDFGGRPAGSDVAVIVPLHHRIDLVEHQLAQFSADTDFTSTDLLYVLDGPALADQLQDVATHLADLYGVGFRLAVLSESAGTAVAANLAAKLCDARLLLFVNADVIPTSPGWLRQLARALDAMPDAGALGPKLLFEDDSIQHAGIEFSPARDAGLLEARSAFCGLHRTFASACVTRSVPAVSGCCVLLEREAFWSAGGLRTMYVRGGEAFTDLCMRLTEAGRSNWYVADVELYRMEGASEPSISRAAARYNAWLLNTIWGERMKQTSAAAGAAERVGDVVS